MKKKTLEKKTNIDNLFLLATKRLTKSFISESKMKDFLFKKGANKEEINIILEKLKRYSFLNEDEIIKSVISFCNHKHYGYNKIVLMLKARDIDEKKIANIKKDDAREIKEAETMTKSLIKRYKNKNTVNLKRNVYSSLIRYGFDENIASTEASKVYNSPLEELNVLKLEYNKLLSSYSRKVSGTTLEDKLTKSLLSKGYRLEDIKSLKENLKK